MICVFQYFAMQLDMMNNESVTRFSQLVFLYRYGASRLVYAGLLRDCLFCQSGFKKSDSAPPDISPCGCKSLSLLVQFSNRQALVLSWLRDTNSTDRSADTTW